MLRRDILYVIRYYIIPDDLQFFRIYVYCLCFRVYHSALGINIRLDKLQKLRLELEEKYDILDKKQELSEFIDSLQNLDLHDELVMNFHNRIQNIGFFQRRLLDAFPKIENKKHPKSLNAIKQAIRNQVKTKK